jgi:hypothetical protein
MYNVHISGQGHVHVSIQGGATSSIHQEARLSDILAVGCAISRASATAAKDAFRHGCIPVITRHIYNQLIVQSIPHHFAGAFYILRPHAKLGYSQRQPRHRYRLGKNSG